MISIVLGAMFLLPLATSMPVYYNFENNPDHSDDAKDNFQYYRPDDFGNPRSMQGIPTYDAHGKGVTTRSYYQVPAAIEPQEEPTNEDYQVTAATEPQEDLTNDEDQVTAATEPQEDLTNNEDQVTAATEPQEDLTNDEDQVTAATEPQEDLTDDEDQVTAATEPQEDLTDDEDQVTAATEPQEDLTKGPDQVTAATKQQEELTDEDLRDLEVQNIFDVKENKMIDVIIGVGAAVIMLLIILGLGGLQIYLRLKKRRLNAKWREAKRKKRNRRVQEVTVEEGLPNDTDAIPPQNTLQESLPTTSEGRKATFGLPQSPGSSSEIMNDKQKRGKRKVPETTVEITPQESPPTTSEGRKATFGLPQSPSSSSEIMNDKQKRGKRKVPETTVEITPQESPPTTSEGRKTTFGLPQSPGSSSMNDKQKRGKRKVLETTVEITPQESPPTTSTRKNVTFDLPQLQRSPSPPSSLPRLSIVPSVESGCNTSQSAAKFPLVEFPIDPSNAVTLATIYYGQASAASSITFQFISESDK